MLLKLGLIALMHFGFVTSVFVPNESANKPAYTAGVKTTNWKSSQPVINQNYSHINYQQHTNSKNLDDIYDNNRAGKYINQRTETFDQQIENDNFGNFDQKLTSSFDQSIDTFDQQTQDFDQKLSSSQRTPQKIQHYHQASNFRPTNYFSGQHVHHNAQNTGISQPISKCPPGETGQFVYESSCNQFLNCWKGRGVPQNCPPGTLFNPSSLECDFAEKVRCITGPKNFQTESITDKQQAHCPSGFSGIIPYYKNCSKFINCDNGKENIMDCPPGTLFSVKSNLCDFPYKVDCVNGDEGKEQSCGAQGCQRGHQLHNSYYSGSQGNNYDDGQYRGHQHQSGQQHQGGSWQYRGENQNHGQYSGQYQGGKKYDDGTYRGESHGGHSSGQYHGGRQAGRYDNGQYHGENQGQYYGANQGRRIDGQNQGHKYDGESHGQYHGGRQGGRYDDGQYHGENQGQYYGAHQGRRFDGQNTGENQDRRFVVGQGSQAANAGQYQGQPLNIRQNQTNAQGFWSGSSQSFGGQTSASQWQTTQQPPTTQRKGESLSALLTSLNQRPKCPPGKTGLAKHPTICAKFLNCNNGQTFIQDCGPGTVFNPAISACDFPYNVNCKNIEESAGSASHTGTYTGSNSGSYTGQGSQSGSYSGSHSASNSGQGSQSGLYSGSNSASHSGTDFGHGSQSGTYSGSQSASNSGQGSQSGSYSGSNSASHSGTDFGQGSQSGSYSGSQSGSHAGTHFGQGSQTGSYSGSNSESYSGSNSGQGANPQGWYSGIHSGQNYRPSSGLNSGHVASYPGQSTSGFIGASGQGQNYTRPGFATTGKYSQQGQQSPIGRDTFVKGGIISAPNAHSYGQRPYDDDVENEQDGDGNHGGFGHKHSNFDGHNHQHRHNHSNLEGGGFGHHHHHGNSNFDGAGFGHNHQHQHNYSRFDGHDHQHHHNHSNIDGTHHHQHNHANFDPSTNFEGFGHHNQSRHPKKSFNVQTEDNQNFYQVTENPDLSTSQTKSFKSKHWPPPFPSTDVNADYVFEYEDIDSFEKNAGGSKVVENWCDAKGFECGNKVCVAPSKVCDGTKDCPNGKDELDCFKHFSGFFKIGGTKLAVKEMVKTSNITCMWCSKMCGLNEKCKAFNYRPMDGTCYLLNSNVGLSGALIFLENYDYYESKNHSVDCSGGYECRNKKCISNEQVCNGLNDCGDGMDEKGCKAEAFAYSLHLVDGTDKHSGNLEVHAFNKKGYICDDMFGLRNADVACRELGFPLGALEVKSNSVFAPNSNTKFYMMDDITCLGNETSLRDCDFNGWGAHNCGPLEIVGVVCKTQQEVCPEDHWQCDTGKECLMRAFLCDGVYDCTDGSDESSKYCEAAVSIRLANGTSADNGRVEIRYKGIWGTICDDDFNDDAAKIVCKELGYKGSAYAKKDGFFGPGKGPIWLDQVFCFGDEESVANCTHWEWGEHNCDHSEDVGVICSNFDTSGKPRHIDETHVEPMLPKGPILPKKCGMRSDDLFSEPSDVHFRVVRGSLAQKGHYPWQASIRVKGKTRPTHWCGAIVISSSFVLTAAHCLIGFSKGAYYVVAGDYNVDTPEGTEQESFIEDFIIHENFRVGTKMNNDIAVVKLKGKGFQLTKDVQAICLPEAETTYERRNCTISGFGSIESGKSKASKDLRAGWLPILPFEVCKMPHIYGESITQGMFCAGSLDEGVDACDGDSGGPFACLNEGAFTLYGITSWGQHCGYANKPGVYVKVAHYRHWIDKTLLKLINT